MHMTRFMGVLGEKWSLAWADAGYGGKSVMAEAAATAIALVRRGCIWTLSLKFSVLNNKWKHRGPTRLRRGADSKASQPVFPARRVLSWFFYREVKDPSKLMAQTQNLH